MSPVSSKFRSQLIISRQGNGGGGSVIIKDPATGRFFRLREAEYSIAEQLDGLTPLDVVRQRVEHKFGVTLEDGEIAKFVGQLDRLGLLDSEGLRPDGPAPPRRRIRGSLLYLRFGAFDPDRALDRLAPKARFFFTPYFLILSVAVILCALAITVLQGNEITRGIRNLWRFDALLMAWLTVFFIVTLHEFAHGLTCKHFGGAVHEMGFMLIYFQPAFYCNVSDAWLFPERSRRLWVTFAGAYFEIFLWALATLTWRLVEPGTWVSFLALVVMATSGIKSLFNLNPLIKLDGYYLLSDYLEIPNLRQRAFGYLSDRARSLWRGPVREPADVGTRERRIYLLYGLLAWLYSSWLLGYVGLYFGRYLVKEYRGLGLILFGGLLMLFFRKRLAQLRSRAAARFKAPLPRGPAAALAAAGIVLALLFLVPMELKVSGEFRVLPVHNSDVRAEVAGIVEEVYVDEGQRVHRGDPIARLGSRDLRADLEKTSAEIAEKAAYLRKLQAGARPEEIALTQRALETSNAKLEQWGKRYEDAKRVRAETLAKATSAGEKARERRGYAESNLERYRALLEGGLVSRKQFEEAEEQVAVRRREVEEARADLSAVLADDLSDFRKELAVAAKEAQEAKAKLALLLAGSRKEEIEAMTAEVTRLTAHHRDLEEQLGLLKIVSRISGIVTTPSVRLKEKIGQYANKGDLIAEVYDLNTIIAEIAVPEKEIADVKPGQKVRVRSRAYFGIDFEGRVKSLAAAVTAPEGGGASAPWSAERTILVTTELDNRSLLLKPGMTGHAKISCEGRRGFHLIARRLRGYIRTEFWSWW